MFSPSICFFGLRSAKIRPSDRRENLYALFYNIFQDIGGLRFGFVIFYDNLDNLFVDKILRVEIREDPTVGST